MIFIAIPVRKKGLQRKIKYRGYAIEGEEKDKYTRCIIGLPPYFEVIGRDGQGKSILQELTEGTNGYNYVRKWVGRVPPQSDQRRAPAQRRILNSSSARCNVLEQELLDLVFPPHPKPILPASPMPVSSA